MMTLEPLRGLAEQEDPWAAVGLSRGGLTRFLRAACEAVGLRGEVDVLLAGDRRLRQLNREFRGKDTATDVLSFPAAEDVAEEHAGDLAISVETAGKQAREHGHSLRDEVRVLLLHGVLHLSGMDHETDRGEMAAREAELRATFRLPSGLIARVEGNALSAEEAKERREGRDGRSGGRKESRFPAGMTTRETRAKATAKANATRTKAKRAAKAKKVAS